MTILVVGALGATGATLVMAEFVTAGVVLAILSFILIGMGVGAAGTNLLALLATHVAPERRAPAATIVWLMMIAGFVVTAIIAGSLLDPFSLWRLFWVGAGVCLAALILTVVAIWGVETTAAASQSRITPSSGRVTTGASADTGDEQGFLTALRRIWGEPTSRHFAVFVFFSMLAYSAQDLILEPFAGLVFGMSPGETTRLSGIQHAGVFCGMALVGTIAGFARRRDQHALRPWIVGGCIGSGIALAALAFGGSIGVDWPLKANVFLLGVANGIFAVAAIGSMMGLASQGAASREGIRMGTWGAAQAIAFGFGGFLGTVLVDITRQFFETPAQAYGVVFLFEAALFLFSAVLAHRLTSHRETASRSSIRSLGADDRLLAASNRT